MNDSEIKKLLPQIREIAKEEARKMISTCMQIKPAYVVSVGTGTAVVRLIADGSDSAKNFSVNIVTSQTISDGDYVNLAYWNSLTTAILISK